ncbi:ATP-binding protein [Fulvivirgaceae bacterium BMA12]|uniref:ATP-binding protein n=1 Tax=Agaribacillus aureus TaxID=3051825 RepID=A0ABT8L1I7_9BACT|nr:ATP-binding protein [Fulvivirgaceae bacterium BMA12]
MEEQNSNTSPTENNNEIQAKPATESFLDTVEQEIHANGGEFEQDPADEGSVGRNMFDLPGSKDNLVSVLIPLEKIQEVPIQSLVRIKSKQDDRTYQGIVVAGPFYEPDNLAADSSILVTSNVRGGTFMPRFHGRALVEIIAEERDGKIVTPRFRPIPNNPVFVLSTEETKEALKIDGAIKLGVSLGHDDIVVGIPPEKKSVLPRHIGVLGTTGGGKSTTVSGLVNQFQEQGIATILIDTEGEYTHMNKPTEDANMQASLAFRGKQPKGIQNTRVYTLVNRATTNTTHPNRKTFCLSFENLSPYSVMEILELSNAQQECFRKAYDLTHDLLKQLKFYSKEEEVQLIELDEFERGLPKLTLDMIYDVVQTCVAKRDGRLKDENDEYAYIPLRSEFFKTNSKKLFAFVDRQTLKENKFSWFKIFGRLGMLIRLGIFDSKKASAIDYNAITAPGTVTIIDLSDTDSPQINNLVIAELLRGLMVQQNKNYDAFQSSPEGTSMRKVMVVIEEAHEFLSTSRIKEMPELFKQVARIARRGRKRWLGMTFVTQLPQHLPNEVLGLINNYILHKISDADVISRLKRSAGGIDQALWNRLPNLAPGQAIASFASWRRPLLVAVDPTPCKLLMID